MRIIFGLNVGLSSLTAVNVAESAIVLVERLVWDDEALCNVDDEDVDVLSLLESPAFHLFTGSVACRGLGVTEGLEADRGGSEEWRICARSLAAALAARCAETETASFERVAGFQIHGVFGISTPSSSPYGSLLQVPCQAKRPHVM